MNQQPFCPKEMEQFINKSNQNTIIALFVCPFAHTFVVESHFSRKEIHFFSVFPLLHKRVMRIYYQYMSLVLADP